MAAPTTSNHVTGPSFSSSSSSLPSYYPDFYNFPPFYTRQPNASTWASQLSQWRTFILEYCRHHNLWKLNITEAQNTDLFYNKTIDRKLPLPAIREIFQSLISTDNAEAVASASSSSTGAASAEYILADAGVLGNGDTGVYRIYRAEEYGADAV